jgi:Acetylornithine deacetylase/Succinyl-diaminopimelate desuccinylase and related deacylases
MMIYCILGLILLLLIILIVKTAAFKSKRYAVPPYEDAGIDISKAAANLSGAVRFKTVSGIDPSKTDWNEFKGYVKYIEDTYPLINEKLKKETINGYSLLYRWEGKDKDKKPVLFTAHMDVVPADETHVKWTEPPFSGAVKDGFVWGRGTMDVKIQMIAAMEAVEHLLQKGFVPERDIYLSFGHDEEVGGREGALEIAKALELRGIKFEYVIDEGGGVIEGTMPGVSSPVAYIGIAEKGFANIKLTVQNEGGHSSMPPKHTAVGVLSKAVIDLENHQCGAKISKGFKDMMTFIGPEMKPLNRFIIANMWLFSPIIKMIFSSFPEGNAMLRTTTAATMMEGSKAPNVLPQSASAVVNFRIAPGETSHDLINHIKSVIKNDEIKVEPLLVEEPTFVSGTETYGFKAIEKAIYSIFPQAAAAPYIVLGGTDARKYQNVCASIYRFSPYQIKSEDLKRMHGTDERISLDNLKKSIVFFIKLITEG